jgi:hypothetical protein
MWLQVQILPRRPKEKMNNEEYIISQARGMDLCRTYVDLGTAIDRDKIINLHYLSDEHLRILSRSVAKENEKRS